MPIISAMPSEDEIDIMAGAIWKSAASTNDGFPTWATADDVTKHTFRLHARAAVQALIASRVPQPVTE